jgi:hypothetical protein
MVGVGNVDGAADVALSCHAEFVGSPAVVGLVLPQTTGLDHPDLARHRPAVKPRCDQPERAIEVGRFGSASRPHDNKAGILDEVEDERVPRRPKFSSSFTRIRTPRRSQ